MRRLYRVYRQAAARRALGKPSMPQRVALKTPASARLMLNRIPDTLSHQHTRIQRFSGQLSEPDWGRYALVNASLCVQARASLLRRGAFLQNADA